MAVVVCIDTHSASVGGVIVTIRKYDRVKDDHSDVTAHSALYIADGSTEAEIAAARVSAGLKPA